MRLKLLTLSALVFAAGAVRAAEPPVAVLTEPPVARVAPAEPEPEYTTRDAGVAVRWKQYVGCGTCIASEDGKSLVLTCNHIFDERQGETAPYPLAAVVTHRGKEYRATAVSGEYPADLALLVVDGALPVARIATVPAAPGDRIVHYGNTSGSGPSGSPGVVVPHRPNYVNPSCHFEWRGKAIEGDSGAGIFNTRGELVAVVCGRTANDPSSNGRGAPITAITVSIKQRAPFRLFPRLRDRLEQRHKGATDLAVAPEPPAARVANDADDAPITQEWIITPDGRSIQVQVQRGGSGFRVPVSGDGAAYLSAGDCPNGRCPLPGASFGGGYSAASCSSGGCYGSAPAPQYRGVSGGCSGGSCPPRRAGWYPGKLLGR